MATILKITDDYDGVLEVGPGEDSGLVCFWVGTESDDQSWSRCYLDKQETEELIEYLQKQLKSNDLK